MTPIQQGEWEGMVVFKSLSSPKWFTASFDLINPDDDHIVKVSPFSKLKLQMVSQFPLDFMHLGCLGVMKQLLNFWIKGPLQTRLHSVIVKQISEHLEQLKPHVPMEFARKPRSLKEGHYTKLQNFVISCCILDQLS